MVETYGWPNFSLAELSCRHCGVMGAQFDAVDKLQALRDAMGVPLNINSAYRCPEHNANVGGVLNSHHVQGDAFDISIVGVDKLKLYQKAKDVGFTGFGFYKTFLHVDTGLKRTWGEWL